MAAKKSAAKKTTAKKTAAKKPAPAEVKDEAVVDAPVVDTAPETTPEVAPKNEASPASEDEIKADAEVAKGAESIAATGKYEVVEVAKGKFRMFNERGQAVSPIIAKEDKLESGKPALAKMIRDARRSNAMRKQREIATPKGHEAE